MDGSPRGPGAGADDRGRRGLRLRGRQHPPRAAVDAEAQSGMAVPAVSGPEEAVPEVSEYERQVSVVDVAEIGETE